MRGRVPPGGHMPPGGHVSRGGRVPLRIRIGEGIWDLETPADPDHDDAQDRPGTGAERIDASELEPIGAGVAVLHGPTGPRRVLWQAQAGRASVDGGPALAVEIVVDGWRFEATVEPSARAVLRERARRGAASAAAHAPFLVRAPIPGRIGSVRVHEGEAVEAGAALLTLEAMKMENVVRAPRAGTIARIAAAAGRTVELGDTLLELA